MTTITARPHDITYQPPEEKSAVTIPQYSRRSILAIWAGAALPMAALAWIGAPVLSSLLDGPHSFTRAILICLTAGLVWQFLLVVALVWREQRSLRWTVLRDALWLRSPRNPRTGRAGGKTWLIVIPLIFAFGAKEFVPSLPSPVSRDFGLFLESDAGQSFMSGAWAWFAVIFVGFIFNTVLGEEMLFRGFLLPRMNGAFGDRDWLANGVLHGLYHLHVPWSIPVNFLDTLIIAYPSKRHRSAWIGIAVHSAQSVFLTIAVLALVLK